jgi:hypothetical protein
MGELISFDPGGYRFMKSVFQYSAGVVAQPGYQIVRVRLHRPVPLVEGFQRIERTIKAAGRPLSAFCACELRSPTPVTDDEFRSFNELYVERLRQWGIFDGVSNPVARSNVCPAVAPPKEPSLYAFSYTEQADNAQPSFVVSGGAEVPEGYPNYRDHIVRPGDVSREGMREKSSYVIREMERRLDWLGFEWGDTTAAQVYTVQNLDPAVADEMSRRGAGHSGLTWQFCRPPVAGLEYEMDCRGIAAERIEQSI